MLSTSTSDSSFLNGNGDGNYRDMDDRMTILDSVSIRENYHKPMSKTRKIAFIASIVSIFLVVVAFFLLPCNKNCISKHQVTKFKKTINWMKCYENVEFIGEFSTIRSSLGNAPANLVFMFRNDKLYANIESKKSKQKSSGGIVNVFGNSGEVSWKNEMTNEPRAIDCNLMDCNKSGKNDCLIIDDYGQLACVDENGHWIYYNSNTKTVKQNREVYDFPLIVPDVTNDDVYEIIMSTYKGNFTFLALVSGSNGKLLVEETQNCSYIEKLQIDSQSVIKFTCLSLNNSKQQMFKNFTSLYGQMNKKPKKIRTTLMSSIPQHKYPKKIESLSAQVTTVKILNKEIRINNEGVWPQSKTSLKLTSNDNGLKKINYNFSGVKNYIFTPVSFSVNITSSKDHQNDNIHGFIVKSWTWNGTEVDYDVEKTKKVKREVNRKEGLKSVKTQINNYTNQTSRSAHKAKLRYVTETILMFVFNSTRMKTENTSQASILQFCQANGCQPDLKYQENSLAIADIDNDGAKELISFYSTFENDNRSWKLKTYVQLFKLETELPKLYSRDYDIF